MPSRLHRLRYRWSIHLAYLMAALLLFCLWYSLGWAEEYLQQVTVFSDGRLTRFTQVPIRVFVLPPNAEYSSYLEDLDYALSQWHEAAPDSLVFERVDTPEDSDIQVRWASLSLNRTMDHALGDAKLVRDDDENHHVEVTASLRDKRTGNLLTHEEMRTVCLHELGHALGLWGHSPEPDDVMYYAAKAQAVTPRDVETMRQVYVAQANSAHHESAVAVLQGWIDQTPDVPRFHYLLGSVYQDAKEYDVAADAFLRCLELDLGHRPAAERLVEVYKQLGRTQEAMQRVEGLLQSDPTPQTFNSAGGLYYQQGDLDRARECFRKALELDRRYRPARHNLFALLRDEAANALEIGQHHLAIETAQEALRIRPTDSHLHILLGNAYVALRQYESSISAYQEALKYAPADRVAQDNIARTYNNWGVHLVQQGEFRQGIEKYELARKACPKMADVQTNLEDAYWKMAAHFVDTGQVEKGIGVYHELLAINPKLVEIHAVVGGLWFKLPNYRQALVSFKAALAAKPEMSEAKHNLLVTHIQYGQELDQQKRSQQAVQQFEAALVLKPDYLEAYLLLAQAHRHLNQMDKALAALEKASELSPSNMQIQKSIANVYIQRGNQLMRARKHRAAVEAFEQIPDSQKTIDIYNTIAYLHLSSGSLMESLPALRSAMKIAAKSEITYQNLQSLESQLSRKFDPRPGKEKPGTRVNLAIAHAEMARCLMRRGEYTPAKNKYKAAYDLEPAGAEAKQVLIDVGSALAGKLDEIEWPKNAKTVAGWLLKLDPQNPTAKSILGQ